MQELSCDAFFLVFYEQLVFLCVTEEWVKKKLQIFFFYVFVSEKSIRKARSIQCLSPAEELVKKRAHICK